MRKHRPLRRWPTLLLPLLWACTVETESPIVAGTTTRLTILRTSDIHSRLFPYELRPLTTDQNYGLFAEASPYGGVERIAALIERERSRGERVVYLDSGDPFQGAPIFNYSSGEPEFRWLSTMALEAMVVGNHEFDLGTGNLTNQAAHWAHFPMLAANYIFDDYTVPKNHQLGKYVHPFVVMDVKGLRLAIIGLGDISSMYSIKEGGNSAGITPVEANETARAYMAFLKPSADMFIILSHLGLTEDQELVNGHELYVPEDQDISEYTRRTEDPWVPLTCPECYPGNRKYWVPGVRGIDVILGGHLHILLHPPMVLTDPAGRKVILEHPGAFAKYLTRIDLAVAVPATGYGCDTQAGHCTPEDAFGPARTCQSNADCTFDKVAPYGAEIISHRHQIFPIDAMWCAEPRPEDNYAAEFPEQVRTLRAFCGVKGHAPTRNLLEPYRVAMETDPRFDLTKVFGYAPRAIQRKNLGTGGDSELGNLTALSMMRRRRVEAEFAVTNTLGIRDNLYQGLINMETVFNVFPFENTITIMYLSGREIQELFDYVTERSGGRGCQSQAQIAGVAFTMNCGQDIRNQAHYPCTRAADCCVYRSDIAPCDPQAKNTWECLQEGTDQPYCYAHPAEDILVDGLPVNLDASYKMATNDYIAKGGSGFKVLKRNTTKVYTGISMRDALVEYLASFPTCEQMLTPNPCAKDGDCPYGWTCSKDKRCQTSAEGFDTFAMAFCVSAKNNPADILIKGDCRCRDALAGDTARCGAITVPMTQFCTYPLRFPVLTGREDNRIRRRVK